LQEAYNRAKAVMRGRPLCRPPEAWPLTAASLQRVIVHSSAADAPRVLQVSAHGVEVSADDVNFQLCVEDGQCCGELLQPSRLRDIFSFQGTSGSLRLVILNCCFGHQSSGTQLVASGIPHVICYDQMLRDSTSALFLEALHVALFQGSSVADAFRVGLLSSEGVRTKT